MKWVAVARNGLILWENDAMGLRIILKCLPGPIIYFLDAGTFH